MRKAHGAIGEMSQIETVSIFKESNRRSVFRAWKLLPGGFTEMVINAPHAWLAKLQPPSQKI